MSRNYSEVRQNIRSGDLLAWDHRKWGTWYDFKNQMIRFFTRSEYVHVAVAWVIGGRVFALEAVPPLTRIYPLSKLGDFYHIPLGTSWRDETEEFALSHIGQPYYMASAVGSLFRDMKPGGTNYCSEYAAAVLSREGVDLGKVGTPSAIIKEALRRQGIIQHVTTEE